MSDKFERHEPTAAEVAHGLGLEVDMLRQRIAELEAELERLRAERWEPVDDSGEMFVTGGFYNTVKYRWWIEDEVLVMEHIPTGTQSRCRYPQAMPYAARRHAMTNATQGRRPTGPGWWIYTDSTGYKLPCMVARRQDSVLDWYMAAYWLEQFGMEYEMQWGWVDEMPGDFVPLAPPAADVSQLSDGYHTFAELYEHRHTLFAALLYVYAPLAFKTRRNQNGEEWPGWFIAGMDTPMGQLSYHMPDEWWDRLPDIREVERNSGYDGHTSADVLQRISWLRNFFQHPDPNPWAAVDAELSPPVAAPEPDWSSAPEWAMWWAVDAPVWGSDMGPASWYADMPDRGDCKWLGPSDKGIYRGAQIEQYDRDVDLPVGVDWRTTLKRRPNA